MSCASLLREKKNHSPRSIDDDQRPWCDHSPSPSPLPSPSHIHHMGPNSGLTALGLGTHHWLAILSINNVDSSQLKLDPVERCPLPRPWFSTQFVVPCGPGPRGGAALRGFNWQWEIQEVVRFAGCHPQSSSRTCPYRQDRVPLSLRCVGGGGHWARLPISPGQ